jgi:hypothetical protein
MINQIENKGWSLKNDIVNPNITVPEPAVKGNVTVERHLRSQIQSRGSSMNRNIDINVEVPVERKRTPVAVNQFNKNEISKRIMSKS